MPSLGKLVSEIIAHQSHDQKLQFGVGFSKKQIARLRKFLNNPPKSKSAIYHNIHPGGNGGPQRFVRSFEATIETGFKIVVISPFYFSSAVRTRELLKEIEEIKEVHKSSELPICVSFPLTNKRCVRLFSQAPGWKMSFVTYAGKVLDSLESLNGIRPLDPAITIRRTKLKKDLQEIYRMEIRAFKREKNSTLSRFGFPLKDLWLKNYRKRKNTSHVAIHGKKIIGYISFEKDPDLPSTFMVASISVLPSYQGRGISKWLYKTGFQNLHSMGISRYIGFSSTPKVMQMAKTLKRRQTTIGFYIPGRRVRSLA